jgi:hypothetical protein
MPSPKLAEGAPKAPETVEVDLNTRIVGADERMYVLFPGESYTLFNTIKHRSVLALDFPSLELGKTRMGDVPTDLQSRVAMAVRVRNWHKAGRDIGNAPSRDLKDYVRFSRTEARALYMGAVEAVYFDLKPGTIVVVPGSGHWGEVLIGEVVGDSITAVTDANYPGESIPARRVRWLAIRPKSDFTEALIRRLPTPNPFTILPREFHEEVLTLAFDNVIYGSRIVSSITVAAVIGF